LYYPYRNFRCLSYERASGLDYTFPKKTGLPLEDIYKEASELKVIVFNNNDFKFAEEQSAKVSDNCKRYLQSEWSKRDEMYPKITDYILEHPEWQASVQTHKYLNIP
jgi:organic radical activating enzyme